ncbi:FCD domain-containing protein [Novosphingobium flavum]|uniref:GntR family transcriptional regulator n=1 Tax=Sphingomonadales TaxID=204457 RepID=UPI000E761AF2|nr:MULTISPECIES: FCD domain-containing protein [Sphingomonadaceae]MBC2663328.1 FCD domain-containing protein [Novosphingobium aerophilum]
MTELKFLTNSEKSTNLRKEKISAIPQSQETPLGLTNHSAASRRTIDAAADKPKSLIERAYRELGNDIIHGTFAPGSKIKLEPLSTRYGVSTGTIREALSLLVSDGLVIANAQRGFCIAPMSVEDYQDLVNTRLLLELSAFHTSILNGGDAWEGRVVQAFHQLSLAEQRLDEAAEDTFDLWEQRNREFHEALVSASGSNWTLRFREILYRQSERYRRLTYTSRQSPPGQIVHDEHKKIFDLTLSRKADEAIEALADHIKSSVSFAKISQILPSRNSDANVDKFDLTKFSKIREQQ